MSIAKPVALIVVIAVLAAASAKVTWHVYRLHKVAHPGPWHGEVAPVRATETPLAAWDAALSQCKTQSVHIVIHGDSRSILDSTHSSAIDVKNSDRWANRLRISMQHLCGSHGTGLVPFRAATTPSHALYTNGDFYTTNGNFSVNDLYLGPRQEADPMVLTAESPNASITFTAGLPFDILRTYCVVGPGLHAWTMTVDSTPAGTCGGDATNKKAVLETSKPVAFRTHVAGLECTVPPCEAYGMEAVAGTTGISIDNLSLGNASLEAFASDERQFAFSDLIPIQSLCTS